MKKDKQENSDVGRFVEQDTLGPPDDYFYISDELAANLAKFAGQSFRIGDNEKMKQDKQENSDEKYTHVSPISECCNLYYMPTDKLDRCDDYQVDDGGGILMHSCSNCWYFNDRKLKYSKR